MKSNVKKEITNIPVNEESVTKDEKEKEKEGEKKEEKEKEKEEYPSFSLSKEEIPIYEQIKEFRENPKKFLDKKFSKIKKTKRI